MNSVSETTETNMQETLHLKTLMAAITHQRFNPSLKTPFYVHVCACMCETLIYLLPDNLNSVLF